MPSVELNLGEEFATQVQELILDESRKAVETSSSNYAKYIGKDWLKIKEACEYIGCSWESLQTYIQKGLMVADLGPKQKYISKEEINRFFKEFQY